MNLRPHRSNFGQTFDIYKLFGVPLDLFQFYPILSSITVRDPQACRETDVCHHEERQKKLYVPEVTQYRLNGRIVPVIPPPEHKLNP